jgi:hypothetical protein
MAMDSEKKAKEQRLKEVRQRADALGVKYHHRANADTIEAIVTARILELEGQDNPDEYAAETRLNDITVAKPPEYEPPMAESEFMKLRREQDFRLAGALVRVRVQNMNPQKKEWRGEFISVGSAKLGTYKKFIPFTSEPYHVPRIIYQELKDKKCSSFSNHTDDKGRVIRKSKQIPEYVIETLPQLTPEELAELTRKQAMRQGKEA